MKKKKFQKKRNRKYLVYLRLDHSANKIKLQKIRKLINRKTKTMYQKYRVHRESKVKSFKIMKFQKQIIKKTNVCLLAKINFGSYKHGSTNRKNCWKLR